MKEEYYRRLTEAGPIIREYKECSKLMLARSLVNMGIHTTPWTIEKMKYDIVEMYEDIDYNPKSRRFYVHE